MGRISGTGWLLAGALCVALALPWGLEAGAQSGRRTKKIPVILDTDIGDDIDDTWALGLLLRSPELDVRLVVGDEGKPLYRAKLLAKLLRAAGRTDVPVGIGLDAGRAKEQGPQAAWVADYDLERHPGKVRKDGVQAVIDTIRRSREPIALIGIGPLPNVAAALERDPTIARRARFVGMHGSVRVGYDGGKTPAAEYNVKQNPKACQKVFTTPWDVTITPLDTCGLVDLQGERYQKVLRSPDPVARAIIENYRIWSAAGRKPGQPDPSETRSSILFDTVAIYLAFSQQLVEMEDLPIEVTDAGMTRIQPGAKTVHVASRWKDMEGFRDLLVRRVTGEEKR